MAEWLEGKYCIVSIRNSDGAYFCSVEEGNAFDAFLSRRDDMSREDRADFYKLTDLNGRVVRVAIDELESLYISTPESRVAVEEMNAELKARNIAND